MAGRNGDGPYLDLDRDAWRSLRASTPMSLTAEGLDEVRGFADPIQLGEVEDIYLPLSRLLRLYFEASAGLRETIGAFLGQDIRPAPFIIAVAGSVAVGKSTTARVLQALIRKWPQHPRTELVVTDNFLYPNAVLEQRGLTGRKGFPESYDRRALLRFVQQVRAGAPEVSAPVYSHLAYDILPGQRQSVRRPDVLILEGINVLQPAPAGALALADFFDFSVYVDARADHIQRPAVPVPQAYPVQYRGGRRVRHPGLENDQRSEPHREHPAHPRQGDPGPAQGSRALSDTSPATAILTPEPLKRPRTHTRPRRNQPEREAVTAEIAAGTCGFDQLRVSRLRCAGWADLTARSGGIAWSALRR
jgi:type I pantothenate kinase